MGNNKLWIVGFIALFWAVLAVGSENIGQVLLEPSFVSELNIFYNNKKLGQSVLFDRHDRKLYAGSLIKNPELLNWTEIGFLNDQNQYTPLSGTQGPVRFGGSWPEKLYIAQNIGDLTLGKPLQECCAQPNPCKKRVLPETKVEIESSHAPKLGARRNGQNSRNAQRTHHQTKGSVTPQNKWLTIILSALAIVAFEHKIPGNNFDSIVLRSLHSITTSLPRTGLWYVHNGLQVNQIPTLQQFISSPVDMITLGVDSVVDRFISEYQRNGKHSEANVAASIGSTETVANVPPASSFYGMLRPYLGTGLKIARTGLIYYGVGKLLKK